MPRVLLLVAISILLAKAGWCASVQDIWEAAGGDELGGKDLPAVEKPYLGTWSVYQDSTDQGRTYEKSETKNIVVQQHSIVAGILGAFALKGVRLVWDDKNALWEEICLTEMGTLWILQVRGDMPGTMVCIVVENDDGGSQSTHMFQLLKE